MAVAGVLVSQGHKVSIWWQVGTYFFITVAELCISPVGLELAFTAAPKSMKGFITGCFLLMVFLGDMLNSVVTRMYRPSSEMPMGPAQYFGAMTGLMLVVTVVFIFVARQFNRTVEKQAPLPVGSTDSEKITERNQYQTPA